MAEVKFKRKSTSEISNLPIDDGSFIVNYENGNAYMDYQSERIQIGSSGGSGGNTGTVLYSGTPLQTNIPLEDSLENYDYVEVYYGGYVDRVSEYINKYIIYEGTTPGGGTIYYIGYITFVSTGLSSVIINNTSFYEDNGYLKANSSHNCNMSSSGNTINSNNNIAISKIIGYNNV